MAGTYAEAVKPHLLISLALAAGGGLLTNLAYPYHSWWILAFPGLALLFFALRGAGFWRGALLGATWGFAFFAPLLSWSLQSVSGHWIPWIALTLLCAAFLALFGGLFAIVARTGLGDAKLAVAGGVLFTAVEQLRMEVPYGGFPWGALAYSQVDGPLLRLASVGGTVLVTFIVAVGAAALAGLVPGSGKTVRSAVTAGVVVVVAALSGILPIPNEAESGTLNVLAIQGNVPVRGGEALGQAREITANYSRLTIENAEAGADLVLWPESSADLDPRTHDDVRADVEAAVDAIGVPLVFGTQRYPDEHLRYNEFLHWGPDGPVAAYAKQHPVPFGEYIPNRDFFRRISSAVDRVVTDMGAGTEPGVMSVPIASLGRDVVLGVGICFEVAYDGLIRENVLLGAEFLVIPTNNSSFGFTQEASQQLAMTRFRAVEHGRTAIQISTVGISAIYSPNGTALAHSGDELYTEAVLSAEIPLRTSLSTSDQLGDWPRVVVWGAAAIWLLTALFKGRRPA